MAIDRGFAMKDVEGMDRARSAVRRRRYMLSYGEAIAGVGSRREVGIVAWDEGLKTLEEKF